MLIKVINIGKWSDTHHQQIAEDFVRRITRYTRIEELELDLRKKTKVLAPAQKQQFEAQSILRNVHKGDLVILLDENGRSYSSKQFAQQINKWMIAAYKTIVFVIGGAYGFDDTLYARADFKISLSKLTFNHQIARIMFLEQLYRAFSILNNEPYHNA